LVVFLDKKRIFVENGFDQFFLIGKTPTGRATIQTLKLNRSGLINSRKIFVLAGLHPPPNSTQ
jgi:hypothetical protein